MLGLHNKQDNKIKQQQQQNQNDSNAKRCAQWNTQTYSYAPMATNESNDDASIDERMRTQSDGKTTQPK